MYKSIKQKLQRKKKVPDMKKNTKLKTALSKIEAKTKETENLMATPEEFIPIIASHEVLSMPKSPEQSGWIDMILGTAGKSVKYYVAGDDERVVRDLYRLSAYAAEWAFQLKNKAMFDD